MKWYHVLWVLLTVAIPGYLAWMLFRERTAPDVAGELRVVRAETEIQKVNIEKGRLAALDKVQKDYQQEYVKLTEEQKQQAHELKQDPKKLVRFLLEAAR